MTDNVLNFYSNVERIVNGLVTLIVNVFMFGVTTLAPLAAPIAPAFSVYKALSERLGTPFPIAIAGAIAIEITGMFISKTAIGCHNWNSARNKNEPIAPKSLAIAMATVFFVVVLILSLTIELRPELAIWVYPGFVLIAICVYVSLAIANNLAEWTKTKADEAALRNERTGLNVEIKQAKIDLETVRDNISLAQQTATDNATEVQHLMDEINIQAAKLEALTVKEAKLLSDIVQLQKQRKSEKSAIATGAPTATGDNTTEQARTILTEIRRNGMEISGAELGRRLGKSGTLGRKLKNELWAEAVIKSETIAQPNGQMEAN
ncbi:hypothetical protein LCGC14_2696870 [marine sediment metagenome]|uniref:Uncharacterized protein n=1 Tax=marine sediment metagenome TaxID=412755 RepID=A0A0F9A4F0_9ZZZZ